MSEPLPIRRAIDRLLDGTIRIPGFQRRFVWEPQRAALLMDSIFKGFPVGSVLLWRTQHRLKRENLLGVFELPAPDKDYPVDYVLDGQQRLTSLFSTFQWSIEPGEADADAWLPVYYDFAAQEDAQQSRFVALQEADFDAEQHFPLAVFFDAVAFSRVTRDLPDERNEEIVQVQQRFLEALLPVQTFESEDRTSVAIVFERVNRMGIELDVFQLLTAWTWSDEFDLQQRFEELAEEFADFGFESVGEDTDLMLRCTAAVLKNDPLPAALVEMSGAEVRESFDLVANSIRRAIDFLRTNFHVRHVKLVPYASLLIPLAAFFSERPAAPLTDDEREVLTRWFWRSSFSHRYSGNPQRNIRRDIQEALKLRRGEESVLDEISVVPDPTFFLSHRFSIRTVATKAFVLLLAQRGPKSLISGQPIVVEEVLAEPNRSEFHHCYPRACLLADGVPDPQINSLANFAIISRTENRTISDRKPSEYRELLPEDDSILDSALIPPSLFEDDFDRFRTERAGALADYLGAIVH
ncbi:MAG TPA: DUF262 domain-containing protein [Thermoleophilaceae bacterium]|nr:DUF262 domain-containing protein [Thermoleophilaceae bacterium]